MMSQCDLDTASPCLRSQGILFLVKSDLCGSGCWTRKYQCLHYISWLAGSNGGGKLFAANDDHCLTYFMPGYFISISSFSENLLFYPAYIVPIKAAKWKFAMYYINIYCLISSEVCWPDASLLSQKVLLFQVLQNFLIVAQDGICSIPKG